MLTRCAFALLALTLVPANARAQEPRPLTAEAIMARVAQGQDQAEAERVRFVYIQHADVQSRSGSSVRCREVTDHRVTPGASGQQRALLSLDGHVIDRAGTIRYTTPPITHPDDQLQVLDADHGNAAVLVKSTDIDLVEHMRDNFTADTKSRDGVNAGLFPLTSHAQQDLVFELRGRAQRNGHDTFDILFHPRDKDDYGWKGEAWIDTVTFQPVVIRTALSRSLPLGVRALLGTNVPGLGFTVTYSPQSGGIWFPESFGTEFKIKVLFFFSRTIVLNVRNRDFERTHATSTIVPAPETR